MAESQNMTSCRWDEKSLRLSQIELTELASHLAPDDYLLLGIRLGFTKRRLDQYKEVNPGNIMGALASMLISWRNEHSGSTAVLSKCLSDALRAIGRSDLAAESPDEDHGASLHSSQPVCVNHPAEEITYFCGVCLEAACAKCVTTIHEGHKSTRITEHRCDLILRLNDTLNVAKAVQMQIKELGRRFVQNVQKGPADNLRERINNIFTESIINLRESRVQLLRQADLMESMREGQIFTHVLAQLASCVSTLERESVNEDYYQNPKTIEKVINIVGTIHSAMSKDAVLSNIDTVEMKFIPNPVMKLGRLEEATGWYLEKKIELSSDRIDDMNACIALSGKRVAVGYSKGGVDIIDIETKTTTRVAEDFRIKRLGRMSGDRLIICDIHRNLFIYSESSSKSDILFHLRDCKNYTFLCSDDDDHIYIGYKQMKLIDVFDQSGGSPIMTIKTDLEPWFISVMKTGNIAVTEIGWGIEDAVQVITKDGKKIYRIPGCDDHTPYSTCDEQDNIYVAMLARNGTIAIRKYSAVSELLETVVNKQEVTTPKNRVWLQLSSLSTVEFALCDQRSLFVYRKRTTLGQLLTLHETD